MAAEQSSKESFLERVTAGTNGFKRDGYGVIPGFLTEGEVQRLKDEMTKIVDEMEPADHSATVFTTEDHKRHAQDSYFLNSSDKIRFFYEEDAVDGAGKLLVDKRTAFNKVGHALHWLNPVFKEITFQDKFKQLIESVGYEDPRVVQSMYIFKQPKIGGSVTSHYDMTFLYVEPIEYLMGVWLALDDATLENGCLWFIPGSHKTESVPYRFVRTHKQDPLLTFSGTKAVFDESKFVPAPVQRGSCVLIHGLVWHKSEKNLSGRSRHAYTFHVVDRKNSVWSPDNWLQETETYRFPSLFENH